MLMVIKKLAVEFYFSLKFRYRWMSNNFNKWFPFIKIQTGNVNNWNANLKRVINVSEINNFILKIVDASNAIDSPIGTRNYYYHIGQYSYVLK